MAQVQPSPNNAQPTTNGQPPTSSNSQQVAPISWDDDRMYVHAIHPPIALLSLKGSMYTSMTTLSSVDFEKRQKSLHSKLRSETTYRHLSTLVSAFYSSTPFFILSILLMLMATCRWWSVFWLFFNAKTSGHGPDHVMTYYHVRFSCVPLALD